MYHFTCVNSVANVKQFLDRLNAALLHLLLKTMRVKWPIIYNYIIAGIYYLGTYNYGYIAQRLLSAVSQTRAVVEALYDMTNQCELCHKVILSTANTWLARTINTNCFNWLCSTGHLFKNVGLVQLVKTWRVYIFLDNRSLLIVVNFNNHYAILTWW